MFRTALLATACQGAVACSAVDTDLLGPTASPCELGTPGEWVDVTPPVEQIAPNPGVRGIAIDPFDRSVLYAITHERGVWRTANCGAVWEHVNTGINGPVVETAQPLDIATDPFVPDTIYISPRFGGNSIWASTNRGVHWNNIVADEVGEMTIGSDRPDISRVVVDPFEPGHIIASSMVPWTGRGEDAGVIEGRRVGDEWQWTIHEPTVGLGVQQNLAFLDSRTWIVAPGYYSSGSGTWITRDAGATFQLIDERKAAGGGWQLHRSPDGTLYRGWQDGLMRSTDGGETWIDVFVGLGIAGAQAIVGDGDTLLVSSSVPDGADIKRFYAAPEIPGDRGWAALDTTSSHSVQRFVRDELRGVVYAFNAFSGVQRMLEP